MANLQLDTRDVARAISFFQVLLCETYIVVLRQRLEYDPGDLAHLVRYGDDVFWNRQLCDRWPLVVKLSDQVEVEWFRQVPPISELGENDIGVSGIGTIAAARVAPRGRPEDSFVVASMYARYMKPHPSTGTPWRVGAADVSSAPDSVGLVGLHQA